MEKQENLKIKKRNSVFSYAAYMTEHKGPRIFTNHRHHHHHRRRGDNH